LPLLSVGKHTEKQTERLLSSRELSGVLGDGFVSESQDERLTWAQHSPRLRRQANVEVVRIHATIVP
jgi:hypothetical protein